MHAEGDERLLEMLSTWSAGARLGGRLGGGFRNQVWAVQIGVKRYAARLSTRPDAALDWEIQLLRYLRAAGMHVPEVISARDGRTRVGGLVLFSWLEGHPPASKREWRLVADELSRLHTLTRTWPQRPSFRSCRDLMEEDKGGDVRLDMMPAEVARRVRRTWRAVQGEPTSVVHGDPGANNILLGPVESA